MTATVTIHRYGTGVNSTQVSSSSFTFQCYSCLCTAVSLFFNNNSLTWSFSKRFVLSMDCLTMFRREKTRQYYVSITVKNKPNRSSQFHETIQNNVYSLFLYTVTVCIQYLVSCEWLHALLLV